MKENNNLTQLLQWLSDFIHKNRQHKMDFIFFDNVHVVNLITKEGTRGADESK